VEMVGVIVLEGWKELRLLKGSLLGKGLGKFLLRGLDFFCCSTL